MNLLLRKYLLSSVVREGEGASTPAGAATPPSEPTSSPTSGAPNPAVEPSGEAPAGEAAGGDSAPAVEGAGASGATGPSAAAPPAAKTPKAQKEKDWRDARIAKLTGQLQELREKVNTPAPAAAATPGTPAPLDPTADFNARVEAAARQQVEIQNFNKGCNDEAKKGRETWDDFDARLADLRSLVNEGDPNEVAAYNTLLRAGLETGELATLVYELGQDLDEANRILALPPLRMGIELTKRALKGAQIEGVSKVPAPVRPLAGGRGEQLPVDPTNPDQADNLTTAEWMKRREAQVAARGRN